MLQCPIAGDGTGWLDVIGLKATEFGEITQNNGYYAAQGHSISPILIGLPIESPYATSY